MHLKELYNEVSNVGNTYFCEYYGTTYIGNTCLHCGDPVNEADIVIE